MERSPALARRLFLWIWHPLNGARFVVLRSVHHGKIEGIRRKQGHGRRAKEGFVARAYPRRRKRHGVHKIQGFLLAGREHHAEGTVEPAAAGEEAAIGQPHAAH